MAARLAIVIGAAGAGVLIACLMGAGGGASEAEKSGPRNGGGFRHGSSENGLAAFLVCDGQTFKVGHPVELTFGVIATETKDRPPLKRVKVVRPYPPADPENRSWISVTGPDGKEVRYEGEYVNWPNPQAEDFVALPQGAFVGQTFSYHFDLRTPGTYRLRWHYAPGAFEGAWAGHLVSNEIEMTTIGP